MALAPYVLRRSGPGRPIPELRQRMDAIFHLACSAEPWRALPPAFGKPDTVSRCFRRLTHAGLWQRLLRA
ncbi:transposase, partial [Siccirubricoccus soli]|uniref:transposase n=1 Tax=Siccirubricoccus soli TaxID=2899147 RepID=UPI0021111F9E